MTSIQAVPAPDATEVRRKRESADHGSSSWPSAVRAWSVSRDVSSAAIRLTSTSLLGKRR